MVDLSTLTDGQLDLLDKYHKQGLGGLSDKELEDFNSIANPSRWKGLWDATKGVGKAIGAGLAMTPGAVLDSLNPTAQVGKEPDIQKEGITSQEQLAEKFKNQPKEDTSFAGATQKALGWEPKTGLEENVALGTTGAASTLLSGPASLARMLALGAAPQIAAKYAGEGAALLGASPKTQQLVSAGTGLFSPYLANRVVTPLPVKDPQRRAATRTLNQAGIDTTASQDTGRQWLGGKEAVAFPDRNEQQSRQFTNAVTTELGQPTEAVTIGQNGYLPQVGRTIKSNMDNVAGRNNINLGVMSPHERLDVRSSLEQIARDNPRHVAPILDLIHKNTGWTPNMIGAGSPEEAIWRTIYPGARVIPGQHYQRLRSQLWSEANDVASSNPTLAESYRETARSLDRAMGHSIARQNPADANAFQNARQLLENHMVVEKARNRTKGSDQITPNGLESAAREVVGDRRFNAGDTPYQALATAAQKALPTLKGESKDWAHTGLGSAATGAVAGAAAPLWALAHGAGGNAAMEAGLYALFQGGASAAIPAYVGQKLATTRLGQAYLRSQALPATPQNVPARRNNALIQALIASQQPRGK